jgi:hypothetical protein
MHAQRFVNCAKLFLKATRRDIEIVGVAEK